MMSSLRKVYDDVRQKNQYRNTPNNNYRRNTYRKRFDKNHYNKRGYEPNQAIKEIINLVKQESIQNNDQDTFCAHAINDLLAIADRDCDDNTIQQFQPLVCNMMRFNPKEPKSSRSAQHAYKRTMVPDPSGSRQDDPGDIADDMQVDAVVTSDSYDRDEVSDTDDDMITCNEYSWYDSIPDNPFL
jgi:hypothetical protein